MPCIETIDRIIDICLHWKRHIEKKTEMGKKLEEEFVDGELLKVLTIIYNQDLKN